MAVAREAVDQEEAEAAALVEAAGVVRVVQEAELGLEVVEELGEQEEEEALGLEADQVSYDLERS